MRGTLLARAARAREKWPARGLGLSLQILLVRAMDKVVDRVGLRNRRNHFLRKSSMISLIFFALFLGLAVRVLDIQNQII
jgi:hypothetical protein